MHDSKCRVPRVTKSRVLVAVLVAVIGDSRAPSAEAPPYRAFHALDLRREAPPRLLDAVFARSLARELLPDDAVAAFLDESPELFDRVGIARRGFEVAAVFRRPVDDQWVANGRLRHQGVAVEGGWFQLIFEASTGKLQLVGESECYGYGDDPVR